MGWVDKALEVAITVVFIADPVARDEAANSLRAGAEQDDQSVVLVGTNGGMLFYGRTSADDHDGNRVSRLRELAGRFGGTERDG